jgi:hypothetical protein
MAEDISGRPAYDPDDPRELDELADRLEAALDRIVRHLEAAGTARPVSDRRTTELARRLDSLIGRLREALGEPSGRPPN